MLVPMSPVDAMFLLADTPSRPMHVGAAALFAPPDTGAPQPGADAWFAADVADQFAAAVGRGQVAPLWRRTARRHPALPALWTWRQAETVDLGYHVQRHGLPAPGGHTELTDLIARLHATPLDHARPLWELHLIEGLADGRVAVYFKIHHALADGVAAMRLLAAALSPDPARRAMPAPWEPAEPHERHLHLVCGNAADRPGRASKLLGAARTTAGEAVGLPLALARATGAGVRGRGGPLALAPARTVFSGPIGGPRRYAARSWPFERLRLVAKSADATVGEVIVAMSGGALRTYLRERGALPGRALTATVPVSLRPDDRGDGGGGNRIGALACTLATDLADPAARLAAIRTALRGGKDLFAAHSRAQVLAMSALGAAPLAAGMLTGRPWFSPAPAVMISNIPGPSRPLYWNGARLDALYPASVPVDGQALNITCASTGDAIHFGLTACRTAAADLSALPEHLDTALAALERAAGL
ncbi:wax ester/triacylglycerol synthase family O-acyltransferase [Tomitella cavernea]|nr:wax ester/triacylglycerol synthase family O-acyltransferase [Tomitella cavernea]